MESIEEKVNYFDTLIVAFDENLSLALYSNDNKKIHEVLRAFWGNYASTIDKCYYDVPVVYTLFNDYLKYLLAGGWQGITWDSRMADFMKQVCEEYGEDSEEYLLVKRYFDDRLSFDIDLFQLLI